MNEIKHGLSGYFKLVAVNADTGAERELTGWFKNLITDAGLTRMGVGGNMGYAMVGSGSAAPNVLDTTLIAQIGWTSVEQSSTSGTLSTSPYYAWRRVTYRFPPGSATGNLYEVGIGWTSTLVSSRSLIKDSQGNPTGVTVQSNEYLDVQYERRVYPPLGDTTFDVVIDGVTHSCLHRAMYLGNTGYWRGGDIGSTVGISTTVQAIARSVDIAAATSGPSGTNYSAGTYANQTAQVRSRSATASWSLTEGNTGSGIKSISYGWTGGMGSYQVSFTPNIAKDATKQLTLAFTCSWDRV